MNQNIIYEKAIRDATAEASNLTPSAHPELNATFAHIDAATKINPWVFGVGIGYKL